MIYYYAIILRERKLLALFYIKPNRPEGGKKMNKYEMMFIVKTSLDETTVKKTVDELAKVLTDMKGKITNTKDMGQRELAYPINKEVNGFYYVFNFEADNEAVAELDRKARINENIIRHLIIKLDEE